MFDMPPQGFDAVFTCPPYWKLEKYSSLGIENSDSWFVFLSKLETVFANVYASAPIGCKFCIMVGDWRSKGVFYDLSFALQSWFYRWGATQIDKVIVSRKTISKIKVMLPQAVANGYTVKVHEYLFVWEKRA